MASRGDGDVALWLHNKLGSTDDLWSGGSVCSQLTREKLLAIQDCFHTLHSHVKVKFMLSFLHLHKRNVEEWQTELEEILSAGREDPDQWVAMVADMLQPFPVNGAINLAIHTQHAIFQHILQELKKIVKKCSDTSMMPLECSCLSRSAMVSTSGHQPMAIKHFALKRKPKSAALRAEILQKSNEAACSLKRNGGHTIPVKIRSFAKNMNDDTPLKGLSSGRYQSSSSSSLGFIRSQPSATGSRFGGSNPSSRPGAVRREGGVKLLDISEQPVGSKEAKRRKKAAEMEQVEQQKKEKDVVMATPDYAAGLVSSNIPASTEAGHTEEAFTTARIQEGTIVQAGIAPKPRENFPEAPSSSAPSLTPSVPPTVAPNADPQMKTLTLNKDQMLEAKKLFTNCNLSVPEKSLILGFIAGSTVNPCPDRGDVFNIRLSQTEESIKQADGCFKPMVVDTFFQMNFKTKEYKQVKKYRDKEAD